MGSEVIILKFETSERNFEVVWGIMVGDEGKGIWCSERNL